MRQVLAAVIPCISVIACMALEVDSVARGDVGPAPAKVAPDQYGDPLPEGASARMGTMRFAPRHAQRVLLADEEKTLVLFQYYSVHFLDVATGKETWAIDLDKKGIAKNAGINTQDLSPDGSKLALGLSNGQVMIWNLKDRACTLDKEAGTDNVQSIRFCRDGKGLVVSGIVGTFQRRNKFDAMPPVSTEGEVKELDGWRTSRKFKIVEGWANPVATADERSLIVADPNGLRVLEWATGKVRENIVAHGVNEKKVCPTFAVSPDGSRLAFCRKPGEITLRDLRRARDLWKKELPVETCSRIDWSPNGQLMACTGATNNEAAPKLLNGSKPTASGISARSTVFVLESGNGEERLKRSIVGTAHSMSFSTNGSSLAACAISPPNSSHVHLWDVKSGKSMIPDSNHPDTVHTLAFSPDGKQLASGSATASERAGQLRLWDVSTGKQLHSLSEKTLGASFVGYSPDGKKLIWHDDSRSQVTDAFRVLDPATGQAVGALGKEAPIEKPAAPPKVKTAPSPKSIGATLNGVYFWKMPETKLERLDWDGKRLENLPMPDNSMACCSSRCGTVYAVQAQYSRQAVPYRIQVYRTADHRILHTFPITRPSWPLTSGSMSLSDDGTILAARCVEGIRVYDLVKGAEIEGFGQMNPPVGFLALSPDGTRLALGRNDGSISIRDAKTAKEIKKYAGHTDRISCLQFAPDGKKLASGSADRTILIWNME